ncbi:hypothetical protein ACHAXS_011039 [Conticribra weissflogii]
MKNLPPFPSTIEEESNQSLTVTKNHHVEIATLCMPTVAAESGIQSGDGTNFILEASAAVIDQLVESDQTAYSYSHGTSPPKATCIEGVVDLERVSSLVTGVSGEEFVDLLHKEIDHGLHHHRHAQHEPVPMSIMEPVDEDQPLEDGNASPGISRISEIQQSFPSKGISCESQPLLSQSSSQENEAMASLSLSADPFVQTIADVHHHDQNVTGQSKPTPDKKSITMVETIDTGDLNDSFFHGEIGESGKGVTVSREAFLISIPATTPHESAAAEMGSSYHSGSGESGGNQLGESDLFVLALPEMLRESAEVTNAQKVEHHVPHSTNILRRSANMVANTVAHVAKDEIYPLINHAFAPLPTDVKHIELRVSTIPDRGNKPENEVHLDVIVDRKVPLIGYFILVSGLVALASVGAALDLQTGGVSSLMKSFWRFGSTALVFLVLAMKTFNRHEFSRFSTIELFVWMPFAAVNYAFLCTAFVIALEMTSLVNAFILSNMASLIIIGSKFAMGSPVLFFEGLGALIGFIGALICANASPTTEESDEVSDSTHLQMMGNILAFLASVSTALYLTVAKKLRPKVDLFLFMFLLFSLSSVFTLIFMTYCGEEFEFSFDPTIGLFGWINLKWDRLPLELFMAIICNGVGTTGYIAIMKYFDPVVVTMVMLMEPIVASFIGAAVGVSTLPGWVTWAGDAVVAVGSIMVISSGSKKTESIDATEALHGTKREFEDLDGYSTKSSTPVTRKSLVVLARGSMNSRTKQHIVRDKDKDDDSIEEVEFISVSGRHRALTSSAGGGEVGHTVIWS